jgi:hypothetical protein
VSADHITEDRSLRTNVYIFDNYPRFGQVKGVDTVLRIDSSTARGIVRFPHAAEIVLTPERATAIRDALNEYIRAEDGKGIRPAFKPSSVRHYTPSAPEFKPGDRVKVMVPNPFSRIRTGDVGTIAQMYPSAHGTGRIVYRVTLDNGTEGAAYGVEHYTPNYAALAAEFKPGDLAIVSDRPSTKADGSGYVSGAFKGKAVNVIATDSNASYFGPECVRVQLGDDTCNAQYVHVTHLTKAKAVPA